MLNLGGYDFEVPTMNKNPKFGFVQEYIEKKTIDGSIYRVIRGKRFEAEFSFAYLDSTRLNKLLYELRDSQPINAEITVDNGTFSGEVYLEVNDLLSRYAYINGTWVWTDIKVKLIGARLQ